MNLKDTSENIQNNCPYVLTKTAKLRVFVFFCISSVKSIYSTFCEINAEKLWIMKLLAILIVASVAYASAAPAPAPVAAPAPHKFGYGVPVIAEPIVPVVVPRVVPVIQPIVPIVQTVPVVPVYGRIGHFG